MLYEVKRFEVTDHIYVRKVKQLDDEISSMIKTLGYRDPTDLSLYFENLIQAEPNMIGQTIRSCHIDLEYGNQCDKETEPVNQGTDVLEGESQINSNLSSETSAMFPDCPEKKSRHVLKLKPKFNRKAGKISQAQKPQFPKIQKKGRQAKSKAKSQEGRRLSKNC